MTVSAKREPDEETRPRSHLERQEDLSRRFIRRQRVQREKFQRRAKSFSLRREAARNLFITACLLFDVLVVPEPALILGAPVGFALSATLLVASVGLEINLYRTYFSLPPRDDEA